MDLIDPRRSEPTSRDAQPDGWRVPHMGIT
jgi:hypothetical protein